MTHRLRERHPLNAIGQNPMILTLRYRCQCSQNEVLTIGMALDMDVSEDAFVMTCRQMWRDVQFEVQQHLYPPELEAGRPANAPSVVVKDAGLSNRSCNGASAMPQNGSEEIRQMLTADQVLELIPISRAKLHRMEHDGRFPRGHMMGPHRKLWFKDEVVAWQKSLAD